MDPKQAFHDKAGTPGVNDNDAADDAADNDAALAAAAADLKRAAERLATLAARNNSAVTPALAAVMNDIAAAQDKANAAEDTLLPRQMEYNLQLVRSWISGLADTDLPTLGADFHNRFAQAHFKVQLKKDLECIASYCSFRLNGDNPGFVNSISFGKYAAQKPYKLFNAYMHEALHGLQKRACAALQASPFNPQHLTIRARDTHSEYAEDVTVIICPEDWLVLQEKCEQDAYAKQAWLNALLAVQQPDCLTASDTGALAAHVFLECRAQANGDLAEGLRRAAALTSKTKFFVDKNGNPSNSPYSFAHNWHDIALRDYRDAIRARRDVGPTNIVFVRVSPEDVHAIGNSFGPNPFGINPNDLALICRTPSLSKAENAKSFPESGEQALKSLNEELGIRDYKKLPTLRDFLTRHNITVEQFTAHATRQPVVMRSSVPPTPEPPPQLTR